VAEEHLLSSDRVWLTDQRTPARRLSVSSHPERGVVVLSLWQGDTCTGSFRLLLEDAPALIRALAGSIGVDPSPALRRIK
jgi:hypothetical protein